MTKNRMIPYGYMIKMGKIEPNELEVEIIRSIYKEYAKGTSYKVIAEILTSKGVSYNPNKPEWNKNMVARILQNDKYLGDEKYPMIICKDLKLQADKSQKKYTKTESETIKTLKPLLICAECQSSLMRKHQRNGEIRWVCEQDIKHISKDIRDSHFEDFIKELFLVNLKGYNLVERLTERNSKDVLEIQREIDLGLAKDDIDIEEISRKIKILAEIKYLNLQPTMHYKQKCLSDITNDIAGNVKMIQEIIEFIKVGEYEVEETKLIDGTTIYG